MPRKKRSLVNSGIYHIMVRGVNKQFIFNDDRDRETFIRLLYYYKKKFDCKLYAYCLMNNHVHILFKDNEFLISEFMRNLTSVYAEEFNKKHERIGHLFQDRFKSIYVYSDVYLLRLLRYIHRNPEKAGICKTDKYKWSSFSEYNKESKIIAKDEILLKFSNEKNKALYLFKEFMLNNEQEDLDRIYVAEKLNDVEAIKLIKDIIKIENISEIKKYNKEKRAKIIEEILKINNITSTQISRVLGISKNFKDRLGEKGV